MIKPTVESKYSKGNLNPLLTTIIVLAFLLGIIFYATFFSTKYLEMDLFPFVIILGSLLTFCAYFYCNSFLKITIYADTMVIYNRLTRRKRSIAFSEICGYSFGSIDNNDLSKAKGITFFLKHGNIYLGAFSYENFVEFIEPVLTTLKNYTEEDVRKLRRRYWLKIGSILLFSMAYGYGLVCFWNWTMEYSVLGMKDYVTMPITLNETPTYSDPQGEPSHISLPNKELPDFEVRIENGLSETNMEALLNKKAGDHLLLHIPKRTYDVKVKGTLPGCFGEKNYRWTLIDAAGVRDENTIYLNPETFEMFYHPNKPDLMIIFLLTAQLLLATFFYLVYQRSRFVKD